MKKILFYLLRNSVKIGIKIFLLGVLFLTVQSCKTDSDVLTSPSPNSERLGTETKEKAMSKKIKIGSKRENPYSIENMQKAYISLKENKKISELNYKILTTHSYVRFLPKNIREYRELLSTRGLDFYDHPLESEITESGSYYADADSENSKDSCSWRYTVIPIGMKVPNVKSEKLADLHLVSINNREFKESSSTYKAIEEESFRLTKNNFKKKPKSGKVNATVVRGNIRTRLIYPWDGRSSDKFDHMVGLQGVKVKAHSWFFTHTTFTDENGFYEISSTIFDIFPPEMSVWYEANNFEVISSPRVFWFYTNAKFEGPVVNGDQWDLDITENSQLHYSTIFSGTYDYLNFHNQLGLVRPINNGTIYVRAVDECDGSNGNFSYWRGTLGGSDIKVFCPNRDTDDIYSTTIHELAHFSHSYHAGLAFSASDDLIIESWARCVQWNFTNWRYRRQSAGYNWEGGLQNSLCNSTYTPLFIDMMDDRSQAYCQVSIDNVSGYELSQLENVVFNSWTKDLVKQRLRDWYDNPTEGFLDEYFNQF